MPTTISIHSFRGGTGKSNVTASLAALLAEAGHRVGVVDADVQSPGIHVLFGVDRTQVQRSLNDYLWGRCAITDAALDVTPAELESAHGRIYLIPSSSQAGEIARVVREGYDIGQLSTGLRDLRSSLELDALLIDTHPGLNEETLLSIALSDALVIVLRPDQQDYQGTDVTVAVARRLEVPNLTLIVNKVPPTFAAADVRARVEETYASPVGAVLPHSEEMMELASDGIFAIRYPEHAITGSLRALAAELVGPPPT